MMVQKLEPQLAEHGKRLIKSPKVYIRDSGLVHALLKIASIITDLQGHPVAGASWEGFVIEQIRAYAPAAAQIGFYRTAAGAELYLAMIVGQRRIGFEVKFSSAPKVGKGFWQSLDDLGLDRAYVVAPVERRYSLAASVEAIPVADIPAACND